MLPPPEIKARRARIGGWRGLPLMGPTRGGTTSTTAILGAASPRLEPTEDQTRRRRSTLDCQCALDAPLLALAGRGVSAPLRAQTRKDFTRAAPQCLQSRCWLMCRLSVDRALAAAQYSRSTSCIKRRSRSARAETADIRRLRAQTERSEESGDRPYLMAFYAVSLFSRGAVALATINSLVFLCRRMSFGGIFRWGVVHTHSRVPSVNCAAELFLLFLRTVTPREPAPTCRTASEIAS